jgi:hypothetical protein
MKPENVISPILIEKEQISSLHFPKNDVLHTEDAKKQRLNNLERAMKLGNLEHNKIKIYFEDDTSQKLVETTIWSVTNERIILKQGMVIPINRIYDVE